MPKIIIRFDKSTYNYDDAQSFYSEFFESLGLDSEKKFEEQEVEIGIQTEVRLFGMKEIVPKNVVETNYWVCRLLKSGGLITFSVGDFAWAADLVLRFTSSPKEDLEKACTSSSLRALWIRGAMSLTDIAPLRSLNNLSSLKLGACSSLTDLKPLAELSALRSLTIHGSKALDDLSPIRHIESLFYLSVKDCRNICVIPPLSSLNNLSHLKLESCDLLKDLSPLAGLQAISNLSLSSCKSLSDLSPLAGLKTLTYLDLSYCRSLFEISHIADLRILAKLDFSCCESLSDLSPLCSLQALTSLNLRKCISLSDISPLVKLKMLNNLNLSWCKALKEISPLANLKNLKKLNLGGCASITNISHLYDLKKLEELDLSNCGISDISPLSHLINLIKLDLGGNNPTEISSLIPLQSLEELNIGWCSSIASFSPLSRLYKLKNLRLAHSKISDISPLKYLSSITNLEIEYFNKITDISPISELKKLANLKLHCQLLDDLNPIRNLKNLTHLSLRGCESVIDISPLVSLENIKKIDLSHCNAISNISFLGNARRLESLYFSSRRIQSIESLRSISSLKRLSSEEGEEASFNPPEVAELLAHTATLRMDRDFIVANSRNWLNEAKGWREGAPSVQERFAATLGEAFSLLGESPIEPAYEDFINNRPEFTSSPWKAWFGGTLKESGFDLYRQRVERVPVSEMLPGAIGGTCATLPYEAQADWSRMWLTALESARLSDAKNLLSVAPEICLALARLGLSKSLRAWLLAFTDPSDPGALDPVHAALAGFQLAKENLPAAENHIFAIESPKLRDPALAELVTALADVNPDKASANLLLIENPATRTNLAKPLATSAGFSASETALHRLVVAMGDSPEALGELISSLPETSTESLLIQKISESLRLDRQTTLRKIARELHRQADRMFYESSSCSPST
jgi:Leucine-rich repeat (LRR) protein